MSVLWCHRIDDCELCTNLVLDSESEQQNGDMRGVPMLLEVAVCGVCGGEAHIMIRERCAHWLRSIQGRLRHMSECTGQTATRAPRELETLEELKLRCCGQLD